MDNKPQRVRQDIVNIGARASRAVKQIGRVSLVGAGPGDVDLLTVKALRIIKTADLIIYDRLVSQEICALFPAATPALYVGKAKSEHSVEQFKINQLLIEQALMGKNICRLKGGDAFIFGRGGEEMLSIKQQGIEVDIVPGITAASGCSTYAGIPLTHRGVSQGCTFVTAHAESELQINWQALASLDHTLVFYMGLSKAAMISLALIGAGLDAQTPVALVERGCSRQQRVIRGDLSELSHLVSQHQLMSPTLILVGKVVNLASQLSWFESQIAQAEHEVESMTARMRA
jgi:uroporphyrin-III C-methyltransferase